MTKKSIYTAEQYVDDVLADRLVVGQWVRLACERHRRDLETGADRGLYFDETAAKTAVAFFSLLRHSKGQWAGSPVTLEPWQQFGIWSLFGWRRAGGSRRFRTSYNEVARKNGKSTIGAGVGLYLTVADGEPGAEVYTAATKLDQARIIHQESIRMIKQSPSLKRELTVMKNNISHEKTMSMFLPLGRDSKTLDGLNVHGGLIDELHAHPTGEMWDVLETATGARRSPLMYAVTTAGSNRQSICFQFSDYTQKVLLGLIDDDAWHGLIYSLDETDDGTIEDWENENAWLKSNPNLGISKNWDDMRDKARKAANMPARLNVFLQKELNIWVAGSSRWISPIRWRQLNQSPINVDDFTGRLCYGAFDLSSTLDLTTLCWVFPPADGTNDPFDVLWRFWIPEENIIERIKNDRVPYDAWSNQGFITLTPGDVIDYDYILEQARQDCDRFDVAEIAFDPWNATHVSNKLIEDGQELVEFRQGFASMSPAMKSLEFAIKRKRLNTGGNPVADWNADNLVATSDPAGNLKPDKSKSREKIDGMVALIMAYHRAVFDDKKRGSVYDRRGMISL